jgi:hypothetical protein
MPVVPFMPLIAQGVGMLGGAFAGKKATDSAQQRSPEEAAALTGATGAANTLTNTGSSLINQGRDYSAKPAGFYGSLLSGNRAAMAQTTAAPRAQLQEGIRGAQSQIGQSGVRGAAKEVLSGNLARQGQSQVAGLTTGVQPTAAAGLAGLSGNMLQAGAPMLGQAGNIFGNLLGQGFVNRKYAREEGGNTGTAIGKLVAGSGPMLQSVFGPKTPAGPVRNLGPVDPAQLPGWSSTPQ